MTVQSITEKFCKRCGQTKPISEFYRSSHTNSGYGCYCKSCDSKRQNASRTKEGRKRAYALARTRRPHKMLVSKICDKCEQDKPAERFDYCPQSVNGMRATCRDCLAPQKRNKTKRYRERQKAVDPIRYKLAGHGYVQRMYGISPETYLTMLAVQGGNCAICETPANLIKRLMCVDHDHATGRVRALLCDNCNTGIGRFNDDVELLKKAIDYLLNHQAA